MDLLITSLDQDPSIHTVLLMTHAATNITLGRALTGDPDLEVRTGCCSLGHYVRTSKDKTVGGWRCEVNGDTSFLRMGEERNWSFDFMEETFEDGVGEIVLSDSKL